MTQHMGPIQGWCWTILILIVMALIPARAFQRLFLMLIVLALFPVALLIFLL